MQITGRMWKIEDYEKKDKSKGQRVVLLDENEKGQSEECFIEVSADSIKFKKDAMVTFWGSVTFMNGQRLSVQPRGEIIEIGKK